MDYIRVMDNITLFLIIGALVWFTVGLYVFLLLFFPEWVGISGGSLFKKKDDAAKKTESKDNSKVNS